MRRSLSALVLLFLVQVQVAGQSSSGVEKRLTADLRFREDGVHTTVTLKKR